jgi:23S rRNA (pseudouridine1915-N3)-methyltransferase
MNNMNNMNSHCWNALGDNKCREDPMNITVACVGKVKEKFYRDAIQEYLKRLSRYAKVSIVEVADEKTPENASELVEQQIKETEGERLLKKIPDSAYVIALAIDGENLSSEELATKIDRLGISGKSHIVLVIGGSLGLSPAVLKRADYKLSFSRMTFPHQLMRVILLEQVYRAYRIINGEPYHK